MNGHSTDVKPVYSAPGYTEYPGLLIKAVRVVRPSHLPRSGSFDH